MLRTLHEAAAARQVAADGHSKEMILRAAARALEVSYVDLERLCDVSPDRIERGMWRPRAIDVEFFAADCFTRLRRDAPGLQGRLNMLSARLPGIKTFDVPRLAPLYAGTDALLPAVASVGRRFTKTTEGAAQVVRSWSTALAKDVRRDLRAFRRVLRSVQIRPSDLAEMSTEDQRVLLGLLANVSGMSVDLEKFIRWARGERSTAPSWLSKLRAAGARGFEALAQVLSDVANATRAWTEREGWRTFAIHLQFGAALERFASATRAGVVFVLPTLDQVLETGRVRVRMVTRADPIDSLLAGVHLSSRGGGVRFVAGPMGAKISEYDYELKLGLPGIFHVAIGEDRVFGPLVALTINPVLTSMPSLGGLKLRLDPELRIFHAALHRPASKTRRVAERLAIACDEGWASIGHGPRASQGDAPPKWPSSERFRIVKRMIERGEIDARRMRKHVEHLERLGAEGSDAAKSAAIGFLVRLECAIFDEIDRLRREAEAVTRGYSRSRQCTDDALARLERRCRASEAADLALGILESSKPGRHPSVPSADA